MSELSLLAGIARPWLRWMAMGAAIGCGAAVVGWALLWLGVLPERSLLYPPLFPGFHVSYGVIHGDNEPGIRDAILISLAFNATVGAIVGLLWRACITNPVPWRYCRRAYHTQCLKCGYSLRGLSHSKCPECGFQNGGGLRSLPDRSARGR